MRVRARGRMPLLWMAVFEASAVDVADSVAPPAQLPLALDWQMMTSRPDFAGALGAIQEAIKAGRTYQVNYTTRLRAAFARDAAAEYEALRAAQGAGYHALIETGDFTIVSLSPELFFRRQGAEVTARPMKGTRPRGRWTAEDDALRAELASSAKDRAENLMIVDLLRNDLGRVARPGTVRVTDAFAVEQYRTVHQMTSTVSAEVPAHTRVADLFKALFPCGSVTGAPKIETMKIIAELEASPREVYCGAIGIIEPGGDCTFNVPIRTLWVDHAAGMAEYGTGAGITADSDVATESAEVAAKAAILTERWPAFRLLETMRLDEGVIRRIDLHMTRARESARYFGFPFDETGARIALSTCAADHPGGVWRVRLLVSASGTLETSVEPHGDEAGYRDVVLSRQPVAAADRFLYHKTTHRAIYDARRAESPEAWDVLLQNESGEVTEFTRGNLVVRRGDALLTPAHACGLLAGCFRAELLSNGAVQEARLRWEDLNAADEVWFINSLRGWVQVRLT